MQLKASEAIFITGDVRASLDYYRDVLGFEGDWTWGDPPTFGGVRWRTHNIFFSLQPELAEQIAGHPHWMLVEGVEDFYQRHKERGADIIAGLEQKPWGFSEYTVRDINGYHLRFAEPAKGGHSREARKPLAPGIRLEERPITPTEHGSLFAAVNWTQHFNMSVASDALNRSLYSVVAADGHRTVGMARVTGDGAFTFYVQDVVVLPECQRQGIGTALMDSVMRWIGGNAPPKAFVGLFTGRSLSPFYEQFGFQGSEHGFYGMACRKSS